MNHPNNPLTLPLPPSQTFSPRSSASAPIGTSPVSDVESSVGAASGRPTDHVLLSMIRAYVDARAANTPSAAAAPDATDVTEEQDRNAKEAAEFKKDCPWEETPEKRYPAPNPEYFTEFEKKYPPDAHGEEASPNARVWRVYRDRVTELDGDLLQGWHKTLDVLLIFVGLFSVIAAAFIIEVSKSLQPDYGEITARGVVALLAQTNASFAAPLPIPSFDRVDASTRALWTNALWFASLTLALIDALLIILVKQWLVEYASKQRQPAASGQTWAWRHHAFRQGLDKWGIGVFISTLSVIIYGALYLFLFGLLVFIFDLDRRLCVVSMGLTILIGGLHLVSVFLPLWFGDCPTTTPELTHLRWIGAFSKHAVMRVWVHSMSATGRLRQQMIRHLFARWLPESATTSAPASTESAPSIALSPAAYDGSLIIKEDEPLCDALVLSWMLRNLPADNDAGTAIGAVGSLDRARHDKYDWSAQNPLRSEFVGPIAEQRLRDLLRPSGHRDQSMVHLQQSSVMRALILLRWKTLDKDFRVSLRSLHAVSVHDVSILSEMLFDVVRYGEPRDRFFHSAIFRRLGRWYAYYPTGTAPLHEVTRQHILLNSNLFIQSRQGDDSFHLDDEPAHALLRLISQGTLSSPESKAVLRFLASIVESDIDTGPDGVSQIDFDFDVNAIIDRLAPSAIKLPTMLWSCFLLTTGRTFMFPSLRDYCWKLYTSSLEQLSLSSRTTNWPLDYVECCLAPFAVDGATQLDWKLSDILAALSVLVQAVLHANDRPNVWSEARNRLLRGLLKHRRKIDDDVDGFQWKVSIMLSQLSLSTHHGVLSKLEAHSARGSYIRHTAVNILSRGRSEDGISTFELFKVVHALKLAKPLMVELAILSHHSLAGLLAPDDDLGELLYALAGGDRCIQLALADTKEFVITASHGRVISGHWWENAKARLLNLTEERWRTRNRNFQHETPEALVDEIEAREACEVCAATIIKARQILDAAATVDSTSSVPHRPHELGGDGAMDGAAPPDAAVAASPNGWRRRTGYLLQSLGIPVHHPPGDTEMRPRGRIETV